MFRQIIFLIILIKVNLNVSDNIDKHYRILGVSRFATQNEIRNAYRVLVKDW